MSAISIAGDTSGSITLQAPAVAGTTTITLPATTGTAALTSDVIGVGQTWQNVTASRAANTTYTNTTGRPIQVSVVLNQNNISGSISVDGGIIESSTMVTGYSNPASVSAIVPNGSTYSVNVTFSRWSELR